MFRNIHIKIIIVISREKLRQYYEMICTDICENKDIVEIESLTS